MLGGVSNHNFAGILRSAVSLSLVGVAVILVATSSSVAAELAIEFRSERLTADVTEAQLQDVLTVLSRETGITTFLDSSLKLKKVSARFSQVPLEDGIKELISPYSSAMVYGKEAGTDGAATYFVTELKVYDRGKGNASFILIGEHGQPGKEAAGVPAIEDRRPLESERASVPPDHVTDAVRAAELHKKANASILRTRITRTLARIRQLGQKMQHEEGEKQRRLQALKEELQASPDTDAVRIQAELNSSTAELKMLKERNLVEMKRLRRELEQLRRRETALKSSLAKK